MDFKLELVVVPVSDVDRAKAFYMDQAGFGLDVDHRAGEDFRVVQLTPPGSACSVTLMKNEAAGSLQGLHLVVTDIEAARAELVGRGTEPSDFFHFGEAGQVPGLNPERAGLRHLPAVQRPGRQRLAGPGGRVREGGRVTVTITGESDFATLTERHRRELHVHCYRMLASFDEAEDAVQETFLRAWRSRDTFDGEHVPGVAVPHRDERVPRRAAATVAALTSAESFADVPWLQPYPDRLLDEIAPIDEQPDAVAVDRETIELVFVAAMQVLPPRQRAVLIARDVLGWPAIETAALLETSVAAANSALQRARATMQEHLPSHRLEWGTSVPSDDEQALLDAFIDAHERCDAAAAVAIAAQDLRITMPPMPHCFDGLDVIGPALEHRVRSRARRRLATRPDDGQPDADRGELPPPPGRHRVPGVQVRRPAHRGRADRRDHHLRRQQLPEVRPPGDPLTVGVSRGRPSAGARR